MHLTKEDVVVKYQPPFPFHMVFLSTNKCDASCNHCSSNSGAMLENELDTNEVFALLDQLSEAGVVDLAISGGEPFLRKDIIPIIEYASDLNFSVGVGSHGGSLNNSTLKILKKTGLNRLQISLDGFADVHDKLRNWPGLFDRAVKTICSALDTGIRTNVCFTINQLNHKTMLEFIDYLYELGVRRVNLSRFVPTGRGSETLNLSKSEWHASLEQTYDLKTSYKNKMEIVSHLSQHVLFDKEATRSSVFVGCQAGRGQGCVTADGTIWPCVLLPLPIGNIRNKTFVKIWKESEIIKKICNRENLQGACQICPNKLHCGGCRAAAYAKTGNYLAADPRCDAHRK